MGEEELSGHETEEGPFLARTDLCSYQVADVACSQDDHLLQKAQ